MIKNRYLYLEDDFERERVRDRERERERDERRCCWRLSRIGDILLFDGLNRPLPLLLVPPPRL